jgi:hypothetical protein
MEIANVCLFFNITFYYLMRNPFDHEVPNINKLSFETKRYYDGKDNYKDKLIKAFSDLFYSKTIEIIRNNSGVENVNNWLRDIKGEEIFLRELDNFLINSGFTTSEKYVDFVKQFKI